MWIPAGAEASGADINLWANVTKADTVGITVNMGGYPRERCAAEVTKGARTAQLPPVWTGKRGGARWSWLIAGNVSRGEWTFRVVCWRGQRVHRRHMSFHADAGIGPKSRGLWIKGSMHADSVIQSPDPGGNGGGGDSLYPIGQCTWWVALHRPDLPFFPRKSGDAKNWAASAAAMGFPVGDAPLVGAVAVFSAEPIWRRQIRARSAGEEGARLQDRDLRGELSWSSEARDADHPLERAQVRLRPRIRDPRVTSPRGVDESRGRRHRPRYGSDFS
jgi:hypothetical protein